MTQYDLSPTEAMFDSLKRLYKQGQLLLVDADLLMGEKGWETETNYIFEGLSYSLNSPDKWYVRWAGRFYHPAEAGENDLKIQRIPFISVHFAADHDTELDEPVASAGWLHYQSPMNLKEAQKSCRYWMCKYWFWGEEHDSWKGWKKTGQSTQQKNLKGTETFAVPLYSITSREILIELVLNPLLEKYSTASDII